MRIGAVLAPSGDWSAITEAALAADKAGLDSIGLWSHYHSANPEWSYIAGWSIYGALAAITERVRLVPMVLNNLHYQPGVLAKESAMLALISANRFELAIGAGDWPESYAAWGQEYPPAEERVARLSETAAALRQVWRGEPVTTDGPYIRLAGATIAPAPTELPRVVVGVGGSRRTARATLPVAVELNLYADERLLADVRDLVEESGRVVDLSLFFDWSWDNWPNDPPSVLDPWRAKGIDRFFISIGSRHMAERVKQLAALD